MWDSTRNLFFRFSWKRCSSPNGIFKMECIKQMRVPPHDTPIPHETCGVWRSARCVWRGLLEPSQGRVSPRASDDRQAIANEGFRGGRGRPEAFPTRAPRMVRAPIAIALRSPFHPPIQVMPTISMEQAIHPRDRMRASEGVFWVEKFRNGNRRTRARSDPS